jgi:DNA-binding NarL/FixJ family response regulator
MKPYALMVQIDADDKYFAESGMAEINSEIKFEYIQHIDELEKTIADHGEPRMILINDSTVRPARQQLIQLKTDPKFSQLPVVILGEVASREFIRKYYQDGANSYIIKPSTLGETRNKIDRFIKYWFGVAE